MITAQDIMTKEVITVNHDMDVKELAQVLLDNSISGAPVIGANKQVIAVVTENDLIDQKKKLHIPTMISFLDSVIFLDSTEIVDKDILKMTGSKVAEICSKDFISVEPTTTIEEIATLMAEKNHHTLPVMADADLLGIIGKADIIKVIAKI